MKKSTRFSGSPSASWSASRLGVLQFGGKDLAQGGIVDGIGEHARECRADPGFTDLRRDQADR
jgi:hypothetical protein